MEPSPAESFLSLPSENFTSLFADHTPASSVSSPTINPMDMMTPPTNPDDRSTSLSAIPEESLAASSPASTEKKPSKKRKSWGQVLPEPKTNLPPRKRAKTDDEKEQRRVERVLRNRRAAQSSRERKRLEVEALETRNKELEQALAEAQKTNLALLEELKRQRRDSGVASTSSSPLGRLSGTLSTDLFGSQASLLPPTTVNPSSLSPAASENQEPEVKEEPKDETLESDLTAAPSSDMTQRPAAMLCDLQCLSEKASPLLDQHAWTLLSFLMVTISTSLLSVSHRPTTPTAMSWKADSLTHPNPHTLKMII